MSQPGQRYYELARRCRASASRALTDHGRAALIRMAEAYEIKAAELRARTENVGSPAFKGCVSPLYTISAYCEA